ncbi:Scr1 family TA system antitoxin-like transcriptional regulator [Saccharothrix stipae]
MSSLAFVGVEKTAREAANEKSPAHERIETYRTPRPEMCLPSTFAKLPAPDKPDNTEYIPPECALINRGPMAHDVVERRVLARLARQQVLTRPNPLRFHVILEEAIPERPVGSNVVMRNQLQRLLDTTQDDHITVQLLPKSIPVGRCHQPPPWTHQGGGEDLCLTGRGKGCGMTNRRKSSYSGDGGTGGGDCVEVAMQGERYAVRDSKNPDAGTITVTRAWLDAIKSGALDQVLATPAGHFRSGLRLWSSTGELTGRFQRRPQEKSHKGVQRYA